MEDLEQAIKEDLTTNQEQENAEKLSAFSKMSKVNLAKQDKKLLIQYAEEQGLLKGLTDRQKERLNRKELADIIKGVNKSKETPQKEQNAVNPLEVYQDAIITAINGDFTRLDALAIQNVNGFILDGAQNIEELDERTLKKIKLAKFGLSAGYLVFKFTGGLNKWKTRVKNIIEKVKKKKGNKK